MHLTTLKLQNFRNHLSSSFAFSERSNVLLGDNGHGKTNIIEAIAYLCLTRSFYAGSDALVLNLQSDTFEVEGSFHSDRGMGYHVRLAYSRNELLKVYTVNRRHIEPFSSVIGKFPVVICSPEHAPITIGGPPERRKFVDFIISQSNISYYQDLLEYRRVLKQRNKILLDARLSKRDAHDLLDPWDEQLVEFGSRLMVKRIQFVHEFQEFLRKSYQQVVEIGEDPTLEYKPTYLTMPTLDENRVQELLALEVSKKRYEEQRIGTSLVGPHRDEFVMKINGLDLRKFASQGQHKTFLVALKLGEFSYLKARCGETPILLLDDIFSELDEHRAERLLNLVEGLSQTFITSINTHLFDASMVFGDHNRKFSIQHGSVIEQRTMATA